MEPLTIGALLIAGYIAHSTIVTLSSAATSIAIGAATATTEAPMLTITIKDVLIVAVCYYLWRRPNAKT